MVWPAIIAAAAAAAQGTGNLWQSNKAARKAWSHAKEAAQNAHQWEVNDLRAAGLNPILSATGGSGASAQPFMATTPAIDAVSAAEKGMASAKLRADIKNQQAVTDAQVNSLNAGAAKTLNDITNDNVRVGNEIAKTTSDISLNASHENLNTQNALLAGANTGLVKGKTAQLPFMNNLMVAQRNAANAAAAASTASAYQANQMGRGLQMTNDYYAANPQDIKYREFSRMFGSPISTTAAAIEPVIKWLGNQINGAGSGSAKSNSGIGGW